MEDATRIEKLTIVAMAVSVIVRVIWRSNVLHLQDITTLPTAFYGAFA